MMLILLGFELDKNNNNNKKNPSGDWIQLGECTLKAHLDELSRCPCRIGLSPQAFAFQTCMSSAITASSQSSLLDALSKGSREQGSVLLFRNTALPAAPST